MAVPTLGWSTSVSYTHLDVYKRQHYENTGSPLAKSILLDFDNYIPQFKKIVPNDYRRMLDAISSLEKKGMSKEEAGIEAFYQTTRG